METVKQQTHMAGTGLRMRDWTRDERSCGPDTTCLPEIVEAISIGRMKNVTTSKQTVVVSRAVSL